MVLKHRHFRYHKNNKMVLKHNSYISKYQGFLNRKRECNSIVNFCVPNLNIISG